MPRAKRFSGKSAYMFTWSSRKMGVEPCLEQLLQDFEGGANKNGTGASELSLFIDSGINMYLDV